MAGLIIFGLIMCYFAIIRLIKLLEDSIVKKVVILLSKKIETTPETTAKETTEELLPNNPFDIEDYSDRKFLNLPVKDSPANIQTFVKDGKMQIVITDCTDMVILHSMLVCDESVINALHKIDTLSDTLRLLRNHIHSQYAFSPYFDK